MLASEWSRRKPCANALSSGVRHARSTGSGAWIGRSGLTHKAKFKRSRLFEGFDGQRLWLTVESDPGHGAGVGAVVIVWGERLRQESGQLAIIDCAGAEVGLSPDDALCINPEALHGVRKFARMRDQNRPIFLGGDPPNPGRQFEIDEDLLRTILEVPLAVFIERIVPGNKINQGFMTDGIAAAILHGVKAGRSAID